MSYRTHTTRSFRAGWARISCALLGFALALGVLGGCQSNSDRDLIARERRLQEDQIYSLQDYVTQYQRLLCQTRQENWALKRQLSEGVVVNSQPSEPQLPSRLRNKSGPATDTTPKFQNPKTPGVKQQPQQDTPPPPEIDVPDVPPLKSTTSEEAEPAHVVAATEPEPPHSEPTPRVLTASYEEPAQPEPLRVEERVQAPLAPPSPATIAPSRLTNEIMLSGEVVANEDGGGPRLAIDVVPFDATGRVEPFDGKVSLMLLAPMTGAQPRNLGRWDFGPNDVQAAVDNKSGEPRMRFFVELPKEMAIDAATELWVRMVPREGMKRLAHAKVELSHPGVFSSHPNKISPVVEAVVAANYTEPLPAPSVEDIALALDGVSTPASEGKWAVALPGQPANLPPEMQDESGRGGWKATSEPIPAAIATSSPAPSGSGFANTLRRSESPLPSSGSLPNTAARQPAKRPPWSPDRGDDSSHRVASRPSWSATR